jgi:two-component system sensor histidine kinase DegS
LYNAARHAEADSVQVYFRLSEGSAVLRVHDDGKGFEGETAGRTLTREGGFGLFSIRERIEDLGGSLSIRSHPGDGATVTVSVPLGGDGSEETGEER